MKATHACEGLTQTTYGWRAVLCGKGATVEEKGKWYCKTHAPSIAAAKRKARDEEWNAQWEAKRKASEAHEAMEKAGQKLIEAALRVPEPHVSVSLRAARNAYLAAKAALEQLDA